MIHARATPATAWRLSKTVSAFDGVSNETMVAPEIINNALVCGDLRMGKVVIIILAYLHLFGPMMTCAPIADK